MAAAAMLDERIFPGRPFDLEMNDAGKFILGRFSVLAGGKEGVDQFIKERLGPVEVGHEENGTANRPGQFLGAALPDALVEVGRQAVAAPADDMTATATGPVDTLAAPLHHGAFRHPEMGITGGDQAEMGDFQTAGAGIAAMAVQAAAKLGMMRGVAGKAARRGGESGAGKKPAEYQKGQTSDQFSPRKTRATRVRARIVKKTTRVKILTSRCSRGNQRARRTAGNPGNQGSRA